MRTKALWIIGLAIVIVLAVSKHVFTVYTFVQVVAAVLAIVLHEVSHGWAALYYGDRTAAEKGRLSLNPIKHIDPFGTLILPALLLFLGLTPIGYAKPVPINPARMRDRRRAELVVAMAGPFTNLALSILAGVLFRVFLFSTSYASSGPISAGGTGFTSLLGLFIVFFGLVNVMLFVFNMLPVPPLDGSAWLRRLVGDQRWFAIERSMRIVIPLLLFVVFFFPSVLGAVISPILHLWMSIFVPTTAVI